MSVYHFTGDRSEESPDGPHPEYLDELADNGEIHELMRDVLEWKGTASHWYFERFFDIDERTLDDIADDDDLIEKDESMP